MEALTRNLVNFVTIFQFILFFVQLSQVLSHPKNKSHRRFLILIILFLVYNLAGVLFPNSDLIISVFTQMVIGYSMGIIALSYYSYFIIAESDINLFGVKNVKTLIIRLIISFILIYSLLFVLTKNLKIAEKTYLVILFSVGLYLFYRFAPIILKKRKILRRKNSPFGMVLASSYFGLLSIGLLPLFVFLGIPQNANFLFINTSFLISFLSFYRIHFHHSRLEYSFLQQMGYKIEISDNIKTKMIVDFRNSKLTAREIEIALLIAEDYTYNRIAENIFIAPKTVSKHASNIFKKTNTIGKKDFYERFNFDDQ